MENLIYINWRDRAVIVNPDSWLKERAKEISEDEEEFEIFLAGYSSGMLFHMSDNERRELWNEFLEQCSGDASAEFNEKFNEYNLDDIVKEEKKNVRD